MPSAASSEERFTYLDGLRGIAAAAVVLYHAPDYTQGAVGRFAAGGYRAVEFFFVLSGFVLAHAYGGRLRDGLSPLEFLKARLLRLFPLYAAASAMTLALMLWRADGVSPLRLLASVGFSLIMLPTPPNLSLDDAMAFPLDFPAWSVGAELVANVAFALAAPRLTTRALLGGLAIGGVAAAAIVFAYGGANVGAGPLTYPAGLVLAVYLFFVGVALYELQRRRPAPAPPFLLPALALAAVLAAPASGVARAALDGVVVFAFAPALVYFAASVKPLGRATAACRALGELSYPLYILQDPMFAWALAAGWFAAGGAGWRAAALFAGMTLFAAAMRKFFEKPVRRLLARFIARRGVERRTNARVAAAEAAPP